MTSSKEELDWIEDLDWNKFKNPELYPEYQTESICHIALLYDPSNIQHIINPTEEMKFMALKHEGDINNLKYLNDVSEELLEHCFNLNPFSVRHAVNNGIEISEELQIKLLKKSPDTMIFFNREASDYVKYISLINHIETMYYITSLGVEYKAKILGEYWFHDDFDLIYRNIVKEIPEFDESYLQKEVNRLKLQYGPNDYIND